MSKTKKMPSSLGKNGKVGRDSEFVIPYPNSQQASGFLGIKTGKNHKRAAITFIGRTITPADVIAKICGFNGDHQQVVKLLEHYMTKLQDFKIGNVISVTYDRNGDFSLSLEAVSTPQTNQKYIP